MLFIIPIRNLKADNILEKGHEIHDYIHRYNSPLASKIIVI
jgi:hypothetical protein